MGGSLPQGDRKPFSVYGKGCPQGIRRQGTFQFAGRGFMVWVLHRTIFPRNNLSTIVFEKECPAGITEIKTYQQLEPIVTEVLYKLA